MKAHHFLLVFSLSTSLLGLCRGQMCFDAAEFHGRWSAVPQPALGHCQDSHGLHLCEYHAGLADNSCISRGLDMPNSRQTITIDVQGLYITRFNVSGGFCGGCRNVPADAGGVMRIVFVESATSGTLMKEGPSHNFSSAQPNIFEFPAVMASPGHYLNSVTLHIDILHTSTGALTPSLLTWFHARFCSPASHYNKCATRLYALQNGANYLGCQYPRAQPNRFQLAKCELNLTLSWRVRPSLSQPNSFGTVNCNDLSTLGQQHLSFEVGDTSNYLVAALQDTCAATPVQNAAASALTLSIRSIISSSNSTFASAASFIVDCDAAGKCALFLKLGSNFFGVKPTSHSINLQQCPGGSISTCFPTILFYKWQFVDAGPQSIVPANYSAAHCPVHAITITCWQGYGFGSSFVGQASDANRIYNAERFLVRCPDPDQTCVHMSIKEPIYQEEFVMGFCVPTGSCNTICPGGVASCQNTNLMLPSASSANAFWSFWKGTLSVFPYLDTPLAYPTDVATLQVQGTCCTTQHCNDNSLPSSGSPCADWAQRQPDPRSLVLPFCFRRALFNSFSGLRITNNAAELDLYFPNQLYSASGYEFFKWTHFWSGQMALCVYKPDPGNSNAGTLVEFQVNSSDPFNRLSSYSTGESSWAVPASKTVHQARKDCCVGFTASCETFYQKRPVEVINSQSSAGTLGDPHFTTFDGLKYTFNGIGEFTLIKANTSQFLLDVQVRTAKISHSVSATVISAFVGTITNAAMPGLHQTVQVEVHPDVLVGVSPIRVNVGSCPSGDVAEMREILIDWESIQPQIDLQLRAGQPIPSVAIFSDAFVDISVRNRSRLSVSFEAGFTIQLFLEVPSSHLLAQGFIQHMSLQYEAEATLENKITGLLGNFNGNPGDDFVLRDGTRIFQPNDTEIFAFGESWSVHRNDSLFCYDFGVSTMDYTNTSFVPETTPDFSACPNGTALQEEATVQCGGNTACIFDAAATCEIALAAITSMLQDEVEAFRTSLLPPIETPSFQQFGTTAAPEIPRSLFETSLGISISGSLFLGFLAGCCAHALMLKFNCFWTKFCCFQAGDDNVDEVQLDEVVGRERVASKSPEAGSPGPLNSEETEE